ncbi:3-hydroxyacyl-CoA dehydrogenase family protein [Horticoccus sp. 23ND18S-11]|uniref:3-hydroxyacyl-CoA dehydrogenase family protein n=1 Tax=Horticoccus sp. 23ND18S-11 TaxID=3391832 RepID=UPI0039C90680
MSADESSGGTAPIRRVGVVGAGVMGSGIAQWLAARGCDVVLRDVQPAALERGVAVMQGLFAEAVRRGKLSGPEAEAGLRRIATTSTWAEFEHCDLVVEAIVEDVAVKRVVFAAIAGVVPTTTLLASNTSALPIEEFAGSVTAPGRVLGLHFFNPVSRMPLVELVVTAQTSAAVQARAQAFIRAIGKQPVVCQSSPGFLVTRVLFFYLNAAVRLWEQGVPAAVIDGALRDFGWPMGPLRLIDEVGVDVTDFIFGELAHYFPGRFVRSGACGRLLAAELRGRKNGSSRGFYRYDGGTEALNEIETRSLVAAFSSGARTGAMSSADVSAFLMRVMVDEARRCRTEGVVASADDVDLALRIGAGFPVAKGGLLAWAAGQR